MKFNCQRLNLLLVFLILFIGHQKYLQSGGNNGAIVQLNSNEVGGLSSYLTGVNSFDYLPVAWESDYGFPDYDREKYPYFFDRPLD